MSAQLEARVAALERMVDRLSSQRGATFANARTTRPARDDGNAMRVQAQLDPLSTRDDIPVLVNYGHFSNPPPGADMLVVFLDGDRSQAIAVASNHQSHRMKNTAPGDTGLFAHGLVIHLNESRIAITGDIAQAGNQTITGDLHVTGAIIAGFGGADQVTVQQHKHIANNVTPTPGT